MEQLFAGQIEFLRNLTAQVASLQAQVNQQPPQAGQFRYAYKLGEGRFGSVHDANRRETDTMTCGCLSSVQRG